MATKVFNIPATIYRLDNEFYGFKCEPKQIILSRLGRSNRVANEIISALENAGFKLAHKTVEKYEGNGTFTKEPMFSIEEGKREEYFNILNSIDRTDLATF